MFFETLFSAAGYAVGFAVLFYFAGIIRYIPNNRIGVVERRFGVRGSLRSGFIARHGETGFQPDVLRGGWHVFPPFQCRVHVLPLVTVPQGHIGYVFARDGQDLRPEQTLADNTRVRDFEDTRAFLEGGGQKGPQRSLIREGTYAINLAQFVVMTDDALYFLPVDAGDAPRFQRMRDEIAARDGFIPVGISGSHDEIGVVTVHDGPPLPSGEVIAPTVGNDDTRSAHDNFQDPDAFITAGGRRGRQLQVLAEGTWYINRLFATVERVPKTVVEVGYVGVVVAYTGDRGVDTSGPAYKHGELVPVGARGVWEEPLLPGKYAFNTYAGKVIIVPTTNFILKWIRAQTGSHRFDENLAEVSLITRDAFEPWLPLSVVVHIDYRMAPLVVQRFGDIKRLVEQTLDPMVAAYFKNVAQRRTLIELLQDRAALQQSASEEMKEKFSHYNLELEEVLIGTPSSGEGHHQIEEILSQLRARQIAMEQVETYTRQQTASIQERELREAEARARSQTRLTESEVAILVHGNEGRADLARAEQNAAQIRLMAQAESDRLSLTAQGEAARVVAMAEADATRVLRSGEAEADRAARVGVAQALAVEEQVRAYGGAHFSLIQQVMGRFSEAVEKGGLDVVPKIALGGAAGSGNAMEALLGVLLSDRVEGLGGKLGVGEPRTSSPEVLALRAGLKRDAAASAPDPNG